MGQLRLPNYTVTGPVEHECALNIKRMCCVHKPFLVATRNFNAPGLIAAFEAQLSYK